MLSGLSFINKQRKSGVRFPPKSFSPFLVQKREISGENHGKRTLDQRVGSGVYHYERTHDLKKKDHTE